MWLNTISCLFPIPIGQRAGLKFQPSNHLVGLSSNSPILKLSASPVMSHLASANSFLVERGSLCITRGHSYHSRYSCSRWVPTGATTNTCPPPPSPLPHPYRCKQPPTLERGSIFPSHECGLAVWLAWTNRKPRKWHSKVFESRSIAFSLLEHSLWKSESCFQKAQVRCLNDQTTVKGTLKDEGPSWMFQLLLISWQNRAPLVTPAVPGGVEETPSWTTSSIVRNHISYSFKPLSLGLLVIQQ